MQNDRTFLDIVLGWHYTLTSLIRLRKRFALEDDWLNPTTGPEALAYHLSRLNLDDVEAQNNALIKSGKVSKRDQAVKVLNIVEGMRRNDMHPRELMIRHVPVIPAVFRPFSLAGSTFIPGDANELYRDLFTNRKVYDEAKRELGPEGEGEATGNLYSAVRALYGFGEPVNDKARARGVSGFFEKIVGSSPKFGYAQRRLAEQVIFCKRGECQTEGGMD